MFLLDGKICLSTCGIVYKTDKEKGIDCYVDADFVDGWDQAHASNTENAMSHMEYVITYVGCPVLWCCKF